MKPMLERKRRARINRCLDELKELMLTALQAEGENVSKLEKADILELTVQHLHKLRRQHRLSSCSTANVTTNTTSTNINNGNTSLAGITDVDRFRAGFTHCATEVSRCLASTPGVDVQLGSKLMTHLGHRLNEMEKFTPLSIHINSNSNRSHSSNNCNSSSSGTCSPAPSSPGGSVSSVDSSGSTLYNMPLTPPSSRKGSPTFSEMYTTAVPPLATSICDPNRLLTVVVTDSSQSSSRSKYHHPQMVPVRISSAPVWRPW